MTYMKEQYHVRDAELRESDRIVVVSSTASGLDGHTGIITRIWRGTFEFQDSFELKMPFRLFGTVPVKASMLELISRKQGRRRWR